MLKETVFSTLGFPDEAAPHFLKKEGKGEKTINGTVWIYFLCLDRYSTWEWDYEVGGYPFERKVVVIFDKMGIVTEAKEVRSSFIVSVSWPDEKTEIISFEKCDKILDKIFNAKSKLRI